MPGYRPTHRAPRPTHRAPRPTGRTRVSGWLVGAVSVVAVVGAVVGGIAVLGDDPGTGSPGAGSSTGTSGGSGQSADQASDPEVDPDESTSWGPTVGELTEARDLVAGWDPAQLAGQVIVGRYNGTDPEAAAELVGELQLAGVSMTNENVLDAEQVAATTAAVGEAVTADGRAIPPIIGVDQEGGVVAHLGDAATEFPSFQQAGDVVAADRASGPELVAAGARAAGLELRQLGFTWVWAPVADVTAGSGDVTIGSRSASDDPEIAAGTVKAALEGYAQAGIVATPKHFPGHGSATEDSHDVVPVVSEPLEELRVRDLVPFVAAVNAGAPVVMMSHLDVQAIAPGVPSSLAPEAYEFLRQDLGFEGVTVTDSLGMGSVVGRDRPAVSAFLAGADLLLMPADTTRAHTTLTAAIESGEISRERAEESAARVVALQLWQQRVAAGVPVPADATAQAEAAAAALVAAAP